MLYHGRYFVLATMQQALVWMFRTRATAGLVFSVGTWARVRFVHAWHHATADSPPRQSWKHHPYTALRAPSHPTHGATHDLLSVCVWKMCTLHAESVRTQRVFASAAGRMLLCVQASQFPLSHPCSFGSHVTGDVPWLPKTQKYMQILS